jgi:cyclopropane-fatty-acyl-phospholipid synthase
VSEADVAERFGRFESPLGSAVRRATLASLRAAWTGGRLDVLLPSGQCVRLGGAGPAQATVRIHDDRAFLRILLRGELGGGEAFVAGEWSSDDLVAVIRAFLQRGGRRSEATTSVQSSRPGSVGRPVLGSSHRPGRGLETPLTRLAQLPDLVRHRRAANTRTGSARNIAAHYDLGNDFYRLFLDEDTLAYSCAYYPRAGMSLADAQRAKLDRLCDWLELSPRDHLLEIGCGWGGMAIHAAQRRGCRVTAITISREQHQLASRRVADAGLADRVDIQLRDYRDLDGAYDKLVSIEMLEAVGYEHLPDYFARCARVLRPGGRFAVQSITMPDDRFDAYRRRVDWMQTYIFPGSLIPSIAAIRAASRPAGFVIERADDIGPDYAPTLRAWRARFLAELPRVRALGFDEAFVRTWLLYLAFSEAAFVERTLGDHQLLLTR